MADASRREKLEEWRRQRALRSSTGAPASSAPGPTEDAARRLTISSMPVPGSSARLSEYKSNADVKLPPATPAAGAAAKENVVPNVVTGPVQRPVRPPSASRTAVTPIGAPPGFAAATPVPNSVKENSPTRGRPPLRATPSPSAAVPARTAAITPPEARVAAGIGSTTPTVSSVASAAGLAVLQTQLVAARADLAASQAAAASLEAQLADARAGLSSDRSAVADLQQRLEALSAEKQALEVLLLFVPHLFY